MRIVVVVAACLLAVVRTGAARADHAKPIQPGARSSAWFTYNFVFDDPDGNLYIGTCGHCARAMGGVGARAGTLETGQFGTVVYSVENHGPPLRRDFALVLIDPDKHDFVDPGVRFWGGPTQVASHPAAGDRAVMYGWGRYFWHTEPTRALRAGVIREIRTGAIWGQWDGWFETSSPGQAGDSGSPVLTSDGEALGVETLQADTFVGQRGPLLSRIIADAHEDGWPIRLVTAPSGPDLAATAAHCAGTPLGLTPQDQPCVVVSADDVPV